MTWRRIGCACQETRDFVAWPKTVALQTFWTASLKFWRLVSEKNRSHQDIWLLVSLAAVFSIVTQRSSPNRKFQTPKNPSIIPVTWNPEYPPPPGGGKLTFLISSSKSHSHFSKSHSPKKFQLRSYFHWHIPVRSSSALTLTKTRTLLLRLPSRLLGD